MLMWQPTDDKDSIYKVVKIGVVYNLLHQCELHVTSDINTVMYTHLCEAPAPLTSGPPTEGLKLKFPPTPLISEDEFVDWDEMLAIWS